jgi:hypothetical protein
MPQHDTIEINADIGPLVVGRCWGQIAVVANFPTRRARSIVARRTRRVPS